MKKKKTKTKEVAHDDILLLFKVLRLEKRRTLGRNPLKMPELRKTTTIQRKVLQREVGLPRKQTTLKWKMKRWVEMLRYPRMVN